MYFLYNGLATTFLLLFVLFALDSNSQDKSGTIQLYVDGTNQGIVEINGKGYKSGDKITLPAGEHVFKLWAPTKKLMEQGIKVYADSNVIVTYDLFPAEEHQAYIRELTKFKGKRNRMIFLPAAGIALFSTLSIPFFIEANNFEAKALKNKEDYLKTYNKEAIGIYKQNFAANKTNHETSIVAGTVMLGLTAVITGLWSYSLIRYYKNRAPKPVYSEQPPFKLASVGVSPNNNGGMSCSLLWEF